MSSERVRRFEKIGVLTSDSTVAGIPVAKWDEYLTANFDIHLLELKRRRKIIEELLREGKSIENVNFDVPA